MHVPSRLQCALIIVAGLPAVTLLAPDAGAQAHADAVASVTASHLSAVSVTAPVAIDAAPPAGEVASPGTAAPAAQFDADPTPASASPAGGSSNESPTAGTRAGSGPTSLAATAGIRSQAPALSRQQLADRAAANHSGLGTDGVLMIVGGAGFIAGLIIGGGAGTAIAIAGAVIALYGLYLYLR